MRFRWITALILLLAPGCLLIPSDQETGSRVGNKRPKVEITAGAATSDSAGIDYKVNFQWRGADDDGLVTRFQYAVDDTTTQGAWRDTTGFGTLLKVAATHRIHNYPTGDTLTDWHTFYLRAVDNEYATSVVQKRYFNARTIAPTATIKKPAIGTTVKSFEKTLVVSWTGEDLDSSQPDKIPAHFEYKWIRLHHAIATPQEILDSLSVGRNLFLDTLIAGDHARWIRVPGTVQQKIMNMPGTGSEAMVFAVRAVDEAGATEPLTADSWGSNFIMFQVATTTSKPKVTVSERFLGSHVFPDQGIVWGNLKPLEVPAETELRFTWTGNADAYGSSAGNSNYALDIPDPADERYRDPNGIGGWIGWGLWSGVSKPIIFDPSENGQIHIFYVRMRDITDTPASEQLCTIVMKVVAFQFNRTALLVDDARLTGPFYMDGQGHPLTNRTQDPVHDAFVNRFVQHMRDFAPDGVDNWTLYRVGGTVQDPIQEANVPNDATAIPLSTLTQYQALLWNFNFTYGQAAGIFYHEREGGGSVSPRHLLTSFVGAGGKLFLFGGRPLSPMINNLGNAGNDYPKLPPQTADNGLIRFKETNFIWKFLHVRNQVVGVDPVDCSMAKHDEHQFFRDSLLRCVSTNPAYPDLYLDPLKWNPDTPSGLCELFNAPIGGISDWEGVMAGDPRDRDGGFAAHVPDAGLDTLYTAICYSWSGGPPSFWDGAVVAQRYESTKADTLRGAAQGRVVVFMFQPYPFFEGPTDDAGTAAINWLMTGHDQ